jgi:hypothetical protein
MRAIIILLLTLTASPLAAQTFGPPNILPTLNVVGTLTAGSYSIGGSPLFGVSGNYRTVLAGDGIQAFTFYNAGGDTTTYINAGAVAFRSRDYATTFGTINASGLSVGGFAAMAGAAYVGGPIAGTQTARGALDYFGTNRAARIHAWSGDATAAGLEFWSGAAGASTAKVWSVSNTGAVTSSALAGTGSRALCVTAGGTIYAATGTSCP